MTPPGKRIEVQTARRTDDQADGRTDGRTGKFFMRRFESAVAAAPTCAEAEAEESDRERRGEASAAAAPLPLKPTCPD